MALKNNFVYDGTSGVVFDWRWITEKLLFLGTHKPNFDNGTRNTIDIIALGPYSMDLDITSVPKTNSGKSELEVNTANLSGS
jgi:hypothetical protein